MNLFRSEEHVRNWTQYDPDSADGTMPLRDYAHAIRRGHVPRASFARLSASRTAVSGRMGGYLNQAREDRGLLAAPRNLIQPQCGRERQQIAAIWSAGTLPAVLITSTGFAALSSIGSSSSHRTPHNQLPARRRLVAANVRMPGRGTRGRGLVQAPGQVGQGVAGIRECGFSRVARTRDYGLGIAAATGTSPLDWKPGRGQNDRTVSDCPVGQDLFVRAETGVWRGKWHEG